MSGPVILAAAGGDDEKCSNWASCAIDTGKDLVGDAVNGTKDAISTAQSIGDFWSDPAGNTYKALRDAAKGLSDSVLPALTHATLPDLTADWFISAYRISFGLAIFVFVIVLIPQFIDTARGRQSGQELVETLTLYGPAFIIGAMFGPAVGAFLVKFFGALSDSLIKTMLSTTTNSIVDQFSTMIGDDDGSGIVGGAVIGAILMFFMILALLLALLVLVVQLITLYFSGVLFPLGWVWIVDKKKRSFGSKIPMVWLGILAAHPLLFFLLGVTFSFVGSNIDVFSGQADLQKTVSLVVSMLALFIAGLSPLLLFKFAPILPMGGAAAAGGPSIGATLPRRPTNATAPLRATVEAPGRARVRRRRRRPLRSLRRPAVALARLPTAAVPTRRRARRSRKPPRPAARHPRVLRPALARVPAVRRPVAVQRPPRAALWPPGPRSPRRASVPLSASRR